MNPKHIKFQDETKVHPALREYFGYCLYKAAAVHRALLNEVLSKYGIQSHHYGVLKILNSSGPTSQIQIGCEMGIDKASMVKVIDHLEDKAYVARKAHRTDRRVKTVHLTALGKKVIDRNTEIKRDVEKQFFRNLNSADRENFMRLVTLVLPNPA